MVSIQPSNDGTLQVPAPIGQNDYVAFGAPKHSTETANTAAYQEMTASNAFAPKTEIQRTFYSSPKKYIPQV